MHKFILFAGIAICFGELVLARTVTLVFTTRNNGVLRDCGCALECQGGLPERMTLFKALRKVQAQSIFLDSGGFFSTMGRQRNDEIVIRAYESLKYDAIAISEQEFIDGWEFFEAKLLRSKCALVSANLIEKATGKLLVQPFRIVEAGDVRIGITAITSESIFRYMPAAKYDRLEILPWLDALQKTLENIGSRADIRVLLAQVTRQELMTVAEEVEGIDVIVQGYQAYVPETGFERLHDTIVISAGVDGQQVGRLDLHLDRTKRLVDFNIEYICINNTILDDESIDSLTAAYFEEFNMLSNQGGQRSTGLPIFGVTYCRQCHVLEFDKWQNSKHAQAFLPIQQSRKSNRDCIACHTTGWKGAAITPDSGIPDELTAVQCEACHQFDVTKINPAVEAHPDSVGESVCIKCHTHTNSPQFEFHDYWKRIAH
ncbi:hypothetical protein JXJ21_08965 [candidate division KSB1 bacterium]|nr:hypothetical protein [candidate division KSB1 bacterium]